MVDGGEGAGVEEGRDGEVGMWSGGVTDHKKNTCI